jgi:hypothetical protein
MPIINSREFKKSHGLDPDTDLSLGDIARLSGIPRPALQEVYNRGIGAYKTNPESVRPQVKSKEQWAMARVYSFVMKRSSTFGGADKDVAVKYKLT